MIIGFRSAVKFIFKYSALTTLVLFVNILYSQNRASDSDIVRLAERMSLAFKGKVLDGGIIWKECYAEGRRINMVYQVPDQWREWFHHLH